MAAAAPVSLPAADRGALRIADRVVAKIAARAAREVLAEVPESALVPPERTPHASVSVHKETARVRLSVELGYPGDLGMVCGSVRRHVADRVRALTGMEVPEVAIEIERLHSAAARHQGEGRVL
ncbi:Asp23/Gls24 family envelope stress response protein [Streptomyces sp. H10-C2]|uniref:Asp23/Gls24 family envelope stress response protein n=1 Tax=unclassified Streptomyces TaxID=2593676 RepID=UPI0024B9E3DC|nr:MULTISPECIES: Asp23/Gls24 family envelope stress response protein [unclassified Streptomyces]MDJ0344831.1 Asp23/Gls24 family envelope stress response protein [Streptomyces sp. PH10-H1]MDJ0371891.1 Asp23/Gls24 family envelope stress response protein [Streptomyces sp. H10-C2]